MIDLLRKAFESLGFSILPRDDATFYAQRDDGSYMVTFASNPSASTVEQIKATTPKGLGGILATDVVVDETLQRITSEAGVYLWDREEIERQIGRAMMFEAGNQTKSRPEGLASPPPRPLEPLESSPPLADEAYDGLGAFFGSADKIMSSPEPTPIKPTDYWAPSKPWPEQLTPDSEAPGISSTRPAIPVSEHRELTLFSFPIDVMPPDLPALAHMQADDIDITLMFQPIWLLNYRIDKQEFYREQVIELSGQGSLLLSAIDGKPQPNPPVPPKRGVTVPGVVYRIKEPVIDRAEALEVALEEVTERNARVVRFKDVDGEAAVVEHRRFTPLPEDVRYSFELVYQPVWVVGGEGQAVEINATTGEHRRTRTSSEDVEIY